MELSHEDLNQLVKPELKKEYSEIMPQFLTTTDDTIRTPGLFKMKFKGNRMIALTSKCYYADNDTEKKISCEGVNKMQNRKSWDD